MSKPKPLTKAEMVDRIELGQRIAVDLFVRHWAPSVSDPQKLAVQCAEDAMDAATTIISHKEYLLKYVDEQKEAAK